MPLTRPGSQGEEEFHSVAGSPLMPPGEHNDAESETTLIEAPVHPIKSLQGPFEESIIESADDNETSNSGGSAEVRRQTLLEAKKYDETWQARWKQRPTAKYHPLIKLISQIVFGMHLLQQQQAKSEGEVVKILQAHVNEVDTFLEKTGEDFDLAINDIKERIRHLQLPMEHRDVFEIMLDDKKFRTQLLDGNDKIESIIDRTQTAMEASSFDLEEGIKSNRELGRYLDSVRDRWPKEKRVISEIFGAMRGNEQGWARYMEDLQSKAKTLRQHLITLTSLLGEMSRMAAAASRRKPSQGRTVMSGSKSAPTSPGLRSKFPEEPPPPMPSSPTRSTKSTKSMKSSKDINKPLPREPPGGNAKLTSKPQPAPQTDRFERPRQIPLPPDDRAASRTSTQVERPRTAGATSSRKAREADSRANTSDLAAFLSQGKPQPGLHHNPLRSNPPDDFAELSRSRTNEDGRVSTSRPRSRGAVDILKGAEQARNQMGMKPRESTSTNDSSDHGDRKQQLVGTGFARRLSKRMKHLPSQEEEAALIAAKQREEQQQQQYPDSAYASPDLQSSPSNSTGEPLGEQEKDKKPRPESFLAPLPSKGISPLYASRVTEEKPHRENDREAESVRSMAPTGKSRGSTFKGVFQRKWSSGMKMFQTKEIWNT